MYFSGFGGKRQGMFEGFAAFAQLTTGRRGAGKNIEENRVFWHKERHPGPLHFAEDVVVLLKV